MMEGSSSVTPLLFRNLITSLFILAETSISSLTQKHKTLELIRYVFISSFLFFLRLLLSLNPRSTKNNESSLYEADCSRRNHKFMPAANAGGDDSDTAIARALSQLLSIVNDIPVSSRKYQAVRSLAENVIHDNQREGVEALRQVNRTVLSAAFSRTLSQLEAAATVEQQHHGGGGDGDIGGLDTGHHHHWIVRAVRSVADVVWTKRVSSGGSRSSAEKLAAELLWLAETMASCGFAQESVRRWASASILARLSLSAEPRLQASLVKLSALLLKYAKDMGVNEGIDDDTESKKEQQKRNEAKMQMQMLMLWIPLLCIASNGTDVPVLSVGERAELERVMEETIETLEEEDQEGVLSLWLHHFTYCSSSDWPNLHASYARWCNASRKQFLIHNS
ncbi:PREDICTED: uncharacterized protein LOC101311058 [Fragaria vesca subsp. vesca]|uniref:uncharacterized protein LOC101311058 n=1 Tax=Fragaria vesca subsp. vesca TaxID=101020 RepID=UPI0002C32E30|nr:PREDICTED: uncharacterized protein LOC101311058 [Fragaria vesca subsp. vesca]